MAIILNVELQRCFSGEKEIEIDGLKLKRPRGIHVRSNFFILFFLGLFLH